MRRVSETVHAMNITGYVFPWKDGQPVYVAMEGSTFLSIFSTADKLRDTMKIAGVEYEKIKQIDDQAEFLSSFPPEANIRFMIDPYFTDTGTTRFKELFMPISFVENAVLRDDDEAVAQVAAVIQRNHPEMPPDECTTTARQRIAAFKDLLDGSPALMITDDGKASA